MENDGIKKYLLPLLICIFIVASFFLLRNNFINIVKPKSLTDYKVKNQKLTPKLVKSFYHFREALAFKESRGNYHSVNSLGYLGKYQFGRSTLKTLGIYNVQLFLKTPSLQEKAFVANLKRNKWILRRYIKYYAGKTVGGVKITESGILAGAHLAGPGGVKTFLKSYGTNNLSDAYGTSVANYIKRFSGFDTSIIKASKNARVKF